MAINLTEIIHTGHNVVTNQNRSITVKRESPLGDMVALSMEGLNLEQENDSIETDALNVVLQESIKTEEYQNGIRLHAQDLASAVDKAIALYRRDVNPTIVQFKEMLQGNVDAAINNQVQFSSGVNVITVGVPDPIVDFPDIIRVSDYQNKTMPAKFFCEAALGPGIEIENPTSIVRELATDVADYDESVKRWLLNANLDLIAEAYTTIFDKGVSLDIILKFFKQQSPIANLDPAFFVYTLADKYLKEPPVTVVNINLEDYKDHLAKVKAIAGKIISIGIASLRSAINTKTLVVNKGKNNITVIRSLYKEYIEAGGSVESILGHLKGPDTTTKLRTITDNIFKDVDRYNSQKRMHDVAISKQVSSTIRTMAYNTLMQLTKTEGLTQSEMIYSNNGPEVFMQEVSKIAREEVKNISDSDIMNIDMLAMRLVTRSRFFFTDAENYLGSMVTIKQSSPDLTLNEVRFLATMKYVARYMALQMDVETAY